MRTFRFITADSSATEAQDQLFTCNLYLEPVGEISSIQPKKQHNSDHNATNRKTQTTPTMQPKPKIPPTSQLPKQQYNQNPHER